MCSAQNILNKIRIGKHSVFAPFASQLIESIYKHCLKCKMKRLKHARNPIGMVSTGQTRARDLFLHTGLDACGPFLATTINRRAPKNIIKGAKGIEKYEYTKIFAYVFNCQSSGLVHIGGSSKFIIKFIDFSSVFTN